MRYKTFAVWSASKHLSGPRKVALADDEAALVCLLKNGAYYLEMLIDHHRKLGVRHFLFIDNGSTDGTPQMLAGLPDVTVISNTLPVGEYERELRADIARRVFDGGWFLFVDSDELIEFIHGEDRTIGDYLRYLNEAGHDAVVTQCLDMFSGRPLSESEGWSYASSIGQFDHYSLRNISDYEYFDDTTEFAWFVKDNSVSNPDIKLKFGGIRRELFGEYCALTGHRLVRNAPHIDIYSHPHCSSNVRCADFTLLLRHYKFAGNFLERERQQVRDRVWDHGQDHARISVLTDPDFTFPARTAHRYAGTGVLVEQGFLKASDRFLMHFPAKT